LLLLQAGFIYLPFMQAIFGTAALQPQALGLSALLAAICLPLISKKKALRNRSAVKAGLPPGPLTVRAP
jgi:Ca2+-transporting ATPase